MAQSVGMVSLLSCSVVSLLVKDCLLTVTAILLGFTLRIWTDVNMLFGQILGSFELSLLSRFRL